MTKGNNSTWRLAQTRYSAHAAGGTRSLTALISLVLIGAMAAGPVTAESTTQTFTGSAYDLESGDLIYTEQHTLELANGTPAQETVLYVTPDGDQLARKEMIYWTPQRPSYELRINEPSRTETVDPGDTGVVVESVQSGTLEWPEESASVIDGGFHYFILGHFDGLLDGKTADFEFLTPSRVRWTSLRISPEDPQDGQLVLNLNLQNRLLSWAVSDIELTYDIDSRRLLRYSGLTNLPQPGGGNYKARIEYQYDEGNSQ